MTSHPLSAALYPADANEAIQIQQELRHLVRIEDDFIAPRLVAGIDVGYDPRRNLAKAAVVVINIHDMTVQETAEVVDPVRFPYIPGFLSFREAPAALKALAGLRQRPDLLLVDGQGIAHPRRLGIAAHMGVLTDLPAIGVAKTRLCGQYEEPGAYRGAHTSLTDNGEIIGTVLRSRDHVRPLFISPGHRTGHESAVALVMQCLTRYRLPEPTRLADRLSKFRANKLQ